MNRRGFFRGLLAAAAVTVARAYVPSALIIAETPAPKLQVIIEDTDNGFFVCTVTVAESKDVVTLGADKDHGPFSWHVSQSEGA